MKLRLAIKFPTPYEVVVKCPPSLQEKASNAWGMPWGDVEAIKSGLSKRTLKSLKEGQRNAVEGYLSGEYLFVYSRSGFFVLGCFLNAFEEEQPFVRVL